MHNVKSWKPLQPKIARKNESHSLFVYGSKFQKQNNPLKIIEIVQNNATRNLSLRFWAFLKQLARVETIRYTTSCPLSSSIPRLLIVIYADFEKWTVRSNTLKKIKTKYVQLTPLHGRLSGEDENIFSICSAAHTRGRDEWAVQELFDYFQFSTSSCENS